MIQVYFQYPQLHYSQLNESRGTVWYSGKHRKVYKDNNTEYVLINGQKREFKREPQPVS